MMPGEARCYRIELPFPPSVNHYWRTVVIRGKVRVIISADGRHFRHAVVKAVRAQRAALNLAARLAVDVVLNPPDRVRRDLDNFGGKALLDALTHARVWNDDEQIDDLHVRRGDVIKGGKCVVSIKELEENQWMTLPFATNAGAPATKSAM